MAAAGVPVLAAVVLGAEVEIARRGTNLEDVELVHRREGTTTAVWLGDSTAYGIGVNDADDTVASLVAAERGERVVMLAVSGATVRDVVERQLPQLAGHEPDRVYVSVGANDVTHLTRIGSFDDDYREILGRLPSGVDITVLGVPDMGAPPRLLQPVRAIAGFRGRQLDGAIRRSVADAHPDAGVTYVDIAGPTGPPFRRDPDRYFAADRYHPSAEGYRLWADAVLAADTVRP